MLRSFRKLLAHRRLLCELILSLCLVVLLVNIHLLARQPPLPPRQCGLSDTNAKDTSVIQKDDLFNKVRVLCLVATIKKNHKSKAHYVASTWGRRCNKILFFSEDEDPELPILKVDVPFGRHHLTAKTMQAFKLVASQYLNQFDWFLKADDDTFIVMENLRLMLNEHHPTDPVYFGQHFIIPSNEFSFHNSLIGESYFSGGAGYVLSHQALRALYESSASKPLDCPTDGADEDVDIGRCMKAVGILQADSRDNEGRSRFHAYPPNVVIRGYPDWVYRYSKYNPYKGIKAMSPNPISFHYVNPEMMCMLEFFFYVIK